MIRKAINSDVDEIHELLRFSFKEYGWERSNPDAFKDAVLTPEIIKSRIREEIVFIAEIDGKIVGTVSGMGERKSFCVKTLAVHLYHRNKGIGERLMIEVERYAREKDCNKLWLTVVPAMEKAIYLYKKLKYEKEGYLRKHFCRHITI